MWVEHGRVIEGFDNGISIGRSYRDAPEIDGLVLVESKSKGGTYRPCEKSRGHWLTT